MSEFKFLVQDDETIRITPNAEDFAPYPFPPGCIKMDEDDQNRLWLGSMSITVNDLPGRELSRKGKALIQLIEDAPIMLAAIRMLMTNGSSSWNSIK